MDAHEPNNWHEYKQFVLKELEAFHASVKEINQRVADIREIDVPALKVEIAMLKVKSGVWGLVGGSIPVCVMLLMKLFTKP